MISLKEVLDSLKIEFGYEFSYKRSPLSDKTRKGMRKIDKYRPSTKQLDVIDRDGAVIFSLTRFIPCHGGTIRYDICEFYGYINSLKHNRSKNTSYNEMIILQGGT